MPAEATIAPPTAAPISTPPTPPPSSSPAISVTPAAVDKGPAQPPPKPGSAKDRMFSDLRKKAGMEEETPPVTSPKTETPDPEAGGGETPPDTGSPPPAQPKGKVSPWKLVDEHKAARLKAETEAAELRKSMVAPEKLKEIETRAEAAERRAKELDDEMRYVNYSKSQEFAEKYQKPYEEAWTRWMGELGELTVDDPASGSARALQPQDILELVNMPLQKAREQAESTFGSFANDVMSARKEIRGLFEAQNKALEDAKKMGGERDAQRTQQFQQQQAAVAKEINETWKASNEAAMADEKVSKFFKPVEGDEEGNTRLKRGYEIADKAFSVNPLDPRLSADQRKEIVNLHSAVRNRAAAFGRLTFQNAKLEATVKELQTELAKFKGAQPGGGERKTESTTAPTSAKEAMFGALRNLAH